MPRSCKVAVIGAGVAGLVAARELHREGHRIFVFEKGNRIGGTWVYDPRADSDPLSLEPNRRVVHSSLYRSLRTNLPRPLMGFTDYPFTESFGDPRPFPNHEEVLAFLERFARDSGVLEMVRFGQEVVRVEPGASKDEWIVEWRREGGELLEVEAFEAVIVCNGHHTEPRLAEFPGIDKWPGKQIHSHNYRIPEPFQDQIVVIIGEGPSARDISREISEVAKAIHLSSRSPDVKVGKLDGCENMWQHAMISSVHEDGTVNFDDGSSLQADVIFHCTGYKYHFPFLKTQETISIDDNRVGPLYKHVFPPALAPGLSFVGIPYEGSVFQVMELQSKWVAYVLSKKVALPPEEDMTASINKFYQEIKAFGRPRHHTHQLYPKEDEYLNWLASELGLPPLEDWKVRMYHLLRKSISSRSSGYRDEWDPDVWIQELQLDLQRE